MLIIRINEYFCYKISIDTLKVKEIANLFSTKLRNNFSYSIQSFHEEN
jgi:hypothetical protein